LNHGATVDSIVAGSKVEMSHSLAPFIGVYDSNGNAIAGNGLLNGQLPDYPNGALDSATQSGENRVTWQPDANVRIASVVVPYNNGFVVAGRNIREVEQCESQIELLAGITWILVLAAVLIVVVLGEFILTERDHI
jgi:hypothetical protein